MQLKTRDEIQSEINQARGLQGFAAANDDATDKVLALCANQGDMVAAATAENVSAIQFLPLIALALQIIPIIFGEGGFTIEKLQAVLQLIMSIFTT